jgi:hypothetical protein
VERLMQDLVPIRPMEGEELPVSMIPVDKASMRQRGAAPPGPPIP